MFALKENHLSKKKKAVFLLILNLLNVFKITNGAGFLVLDTCRNAIRVLCPFLCTYAVNLWTHPESCHFQPGVARLQVINRKAHHLTSKMVYCEVFCTSPGFSSTSVKTSTSHFEKSIRLFSCFHRNSPAIF